MLVEDTTIGFAGLLEVVGISGTWVLVIGETAGMDLELLVPFPFSKSIIFYFSVSIVVNSFLKSLSCEVVVSIATIEVAFS